MPSQLSNRYISATSNDSLYLVKPFNVAVLIQNTDKSNADMNIAITVTPITAELDAQKMIRILRMTNLMARTAAVLSQGKKAAGKQTHGVIASMCV